MKKLIIAIDGPSGVGKSTLSKRLASELGYVNLDTGAMYRAVALAAQQRGIEASDSSGLMDLCRDISIEFRRRGDEERVLLNGSDVSAAIRTPGISRLTPLFAARPEVREAMVLLQRELGKSGGVVLEGRDIGTVVFPQADIKFFLSASAAERGRRRYLELHAKGVDVDPERTLAEVEARDDADSTRAAAPLRQAEDAIVIDTTELTIEQVLEVMIDRVKALPAPRNRLQK